ncbi:hypothetical protein Nepgr_003697 [Nepenthes gracilis]|uniref:Uncharacterized protein n=1 Tax=Nepenthes gracilis TaxID=150966 RepID=A0AAD3XE08_NEPGR|nr:hypothetical protein Nepgr_003697 [Nepenthes gracilis]
MKGYITVEGDFEDRRVRLAVDITVEGDVECEEAVTSVGGTGGGSSSSGRRWWQGIARDHDRDGGESGNRTSEVETKRQ